MANSSSRASDADAVLVEAEAVYRDALEAMGVLREQLLAGGRLDEAEMRRAAADYRRAALTLFGERKRVIEQERSQDGGGIDLGAARAEIGRRLARLRAAAYSGSVPGDAG